MTRKKLRKTPRNILTGLTMMLGLFLISIDDFSLSALPVIMTLCAIEVVNIKILEKF